MPQISIRLTGQDDAQAAIDRRSGIRLESALRKAIRNAAAVAKPFIVAEAPVRTGTLKRSVRYTTKGRMPTSSASAAVGPKAPHRHLVIRGTARGVEPNPFVDRAVSRASGPVRATLNGTVKADVIR